VCVRHPKTAVLVENYQVATPSLRACVLWPSGHVLAQGSAADLVKLAMCNVRQRFLDELQPVDGHGQPAVWTTSNLGALPVPPARLVLQVHDELVFEVCMIFHALPALPWPGLAAFQPGW
jgi:hypothetical protein